MTNRRPRIKIEPRPATRALPRQPATPIATPTAPADRAEPAVLAEVEVAVTPLEGAALAAVTLPAAAAPEAMAAPEVTEAGAALVAAAPVAEWTRWVDFSISCRTGFR
jgi:hypothetical protein